MHSCNTNANIISHGTGEKGVNLQEILHMLEWRATSYSVIGCPSYSFESYKELYRHINGLTSYPSKYDDFNDKHLIDTHSLLADDVRGELFEHEMVENNQNPTPISNSTEPVSVTTQNPTPIPNPTEPPQPAASQNPTPI